MQHKPLYRHKKRGTTYRILYDAVLQASGYDTFGMFDNREVVVYQDVDSGKVWVRRKDEFFDGRFEDIGPDHLENDE